MLKKMFRSFGVRQRLCDDAQLLTPFIVHRLELVLDPMAVLEEAKNKMMMSMIRNFFVTIVLFIRVCDKLLIRLLLLRPSADLVTSIMQSRRAITAGSSRIAKHTHQTLLNCFIGAVATTQRLHQLGKYLEKDN